jgi:hypothetical protein
MLITSERKKNLKTTFTLVQFSYTYNSFIEFCIRTMNIQFPLTIHI